VKDATLRTVKEIYAQPDQFYNKTINLSGWIRSNRNSKAFGFIELNDGSFFKNIQVVYEEEKLE
jgi:asparaginyl-tRNA synthetase